MRRALLLAIVALVTSPVAAAGAEGPLADVAGYEAITSSHEARGDVEAFAQALLDAVARDPAGEAAALALIRLRDVPADAIAAAPGAAAVLDGALAARIPGPRARDTAAELLAMLHARSGDWEKAREAVAARGPIRYWLLVGPFGFTRRAVHDRPFEIEALQRAGRFPLVRSFETRGGEVGWKRVEIGPLDDAIVPAERLDPDDGCAYLLAQVRAPEGADAVLTISGRGSFKAWWNGERIADVDRAAAYHPAWAPVAITFGPGWNRLVIKATQPEFSIGARIVAADGSGPVPGLEVEAAERIHSLPAARGGSAERRPVASFRADARPFELAARGLELLDAGLAPMALPLLEAAARAEPRSAHLAWLHARALEEADHLPATRRANDARARVEEALARDPAFVPALERRARFLDDDGKPDEALRALRALAKAHPGCAPALRAAIEIARREGWEAEALEGIRALERAAPGSAAPKLYLADHYLSRQNRRRALELYREALGRDASARWVEERIALLLVDAGDAAGAERLARALVERHPGSRGPLEILARTLRLQGRAADAARVLTAAADLFGGDPDLVEAAADVLIEAGRAEEALPALERALAAAPGRDPVRRLAGRIRGEDPEAYLREYEVDVLDSLSRAPGAETFPQAHSICLIDQTVSRVYRDGSRVDHVHQAFKILDDEGVQRYHTIEVPGEPLELRTIATDGAIYEPIITDDTSEILMPKLEPGAVIEVRYRAVHAERPEFQFDPGRFYFRDPSLDEPFLRSRYIVIADAGFEIEAIERNMPGGAGGKAAADVARRGGTVVYAWNVEDPRRVRREPDMPEKDEILPLVELVERRSWEDLSELYREGLAGLTRLTPEIRARAAEVTAGVAGDARKAESLYRFVLEHVRGDQGPSEASEVLVERAGSRRALLKALLDAARVPSRFAMCGVRPGHGPVEVWDPPRPRLLQRLALVIEPRDGDAVWVVDGGRLYPYGLIPRDMQGAPALLLSSGPLAGAGTPAAGGEFATVPEAPLDEQAPEVRVEVRLDGDDARVSGTAIIRAPDFYRAKEQMARMPREQLEWWVEQLLGRTFLGVDVTSFDFPGSLKSGSPFTVRFAATVPDFVGTRGERRTVKTGLAPLDLTRRFGGTPSREHPMLVREESLRREAVAIVLGEGYEVESLPGSLALAERFATYSLAFGQDGRTVHVERSFSVRPARLEPGEYPAVLRFCRAVDEAERRLVELREGRR